MEQDGVSRRAVREMYSDLGRAFVDRSDQMELTLCTEFRAWTIDPEGMSRPPTEEQVQARARSILLDEQAL